MLINVLKRVVMDIAERIDDGGDLADIPCPDNYGLLKDCPKGRCQAVACWQAAIEAVKKGERNV